MTATQTPDTDDERSPDPAVETHFRTCPLCEATCGLEITTKGSEVVRIRGDRADVFSKGFICPKGSTLKQLHEDPDRLRTPLVRRDGVLVEATWDEAFAAVEAGLGRIWADGDRNAVALYLGNPSAHTIAGAIYGRPLIQALGTKSLFSASTVDQMPAHVSAGLMFGNPGALAIPDLDRTDYLLMLGANPFESNGSLCTAPDFPGRLTAIVERGGRVVVVDPRRTKSAEAGSEHIAIRPGTDALWLAAIANEIVAAGMDLGDVGSIVAGSELLADALAPFTPESVAAACRVDAATTRRIARELMAAPTAVVYGRIGTHTTRFGTLASWLADVISTVTGNLDRAGGAMFPLPAHGRPPIPADSQVSPGLPSPAKPGLLSPAKPGLLSPAKPGRGFRSGRWASRVSNRPEVRGELPTGVLAEEITTPGPGQIRGLITVAGNPVRSCQDSAALDAALGSLEFMVSVDIYLNETTRHADVVLPSPSALEKSHFDFAFYGLSIRNVVNFSPPVFETDGPDEIDILAKLALIASGAGSSASPDILHDMLLDGVATSAATLSGGPAEGTPIEELTSHSTGMRPEERIIDVMMRTGPYGNGDHRLSMQTLRDNPHGIDLGALQPNVVNVLRTTDGMIDLAPAPLLDDLHRLAGELAAEPTDGFLLVGRRHLRSNNSWMHNIGVLVKGKPRCTLQVHPDDAADLGLVDGGPARVTSRVGEVVAIVEITDSVAPQTVSLPHGWGHDVPETRMGVAKEHAGVNSNLLTDGSVLDPLSGNAQLNAIPVTVSAV